MTTPDRLAAALADRYRIERELGAGGMATVYLAADLKHDRKVAIKVLKPELAAVLGAERFVQEIKTTAALSHPHILPLFDSGEADGFLYYVMPYIEGETIREKLDRETQCGVEEALRITTEVADALDYAHRHGVIHRDIKPENLLLHDGRAMVMDFGIALAVSAAAGGRMTETGLSLGTPHYMSPEQATADKDITGRSDIYSLASVCYEMLAGEPPHLGNSAQQIIMKIITEPAAPVTKLRKSVPPNVAAALAKALEKLPADRFESAQAFRQALGDTGFTVATTSSAAAPVRGGGRQWTRLGAGIAAGLLLGALGATLLRGAPPPTPTARFPLQLPTSQTLDWRADTDIPVAISPDGRRIAYVAFDSASDERRLYVRDLDRLDPVPVAGATNPSSPFFSDDGEWIGYFTYRDRQLYKIAVAGGAAIQLASDATIGGASGHWSAGGWITYVTRADGIARVRATGGPSEVLVAPDTAIRGLGAPFALPGDARILVSVCSLNSCRSGSVGVLDVATRTVRPIIPGADRAWYLGDGRLAYVDAEDALQVVPFDPEAAETTGPPTAVLPAVLSTSSGTSRVAISRAGAMVYLPEVGALEDAVTLVELDRTGRNTGRIDVAGALRNPRWSPGLDRIAFTREDAGGAQVWIHDLASGTTAPLRTGASSDSRPSWSPDGRRIAVTTGSGDSSGVVVIPTDGSGPAEPAVTGGRSGGAPSWSRDGRWILFDGPFTSANNGEDVYAVGTTGDRRPVPVVATPATEESGTLSPDGRWVAYVANEAGISQVFVRPFMRPGGRWVISTAVGTAPLWTTDDELVYQDGASTSLVAARLAFGPEPRVVSRTQLVDLREYIRSSRSAPDYDISHDGKRILVLRGGRARSERSPVVVLNWFAEVDRLMGTSR